MSIRILLAEDHGLMRQGLQALLRELERLGAGAGSGQAGPIWLRYDAAELAQLFRKTQRSS